MDLVVVPWPDIRREVTFTESAQERGNVLLLYVLL